MKSSVVVRNGVSTEMASLVGRLVELIEWPARRRAMGDVAMTLLEGKSRVAESVFGWNRRAVDLGIHEHQSGIACVNDISARVKPKTEDKHPELLSDIQVLMEPQSQSESSLRTTLLYTNVTAKALRAALVVNGWSAQALPTERTLSNLLNRQGYRLRSVAKTRVQKKPSKPTQSSTTSGV